MTQEREEVVKTWQTYILMAVALAAVVAPVRAGTADPAGGWGDHPAAAAPAVQDSPVWDQRAPSDRPDPLVEAMIQVRPQLSAAGAAGKVLEGPASQGAASQTDGLLPGPAKMSFFIPAEGSITATGGKFAGGTAGVVGNSDSPAGAGSGSADAVRAIPAPTSITLFPFGALVAAFAAWRMGRRRAPLLAVVRATFGPVKGRR